MEVRLGNAVAKEAFRDVDGSIQHRPLLGERVLTLQIPDTYSLLEAVQAVIAPGMGAWDNHALADEETGERLAPSWVESDWEALTVVLSDAYGGIPTKRPDGWGVIPEPDEPAPTEPAPVYVEDHFDPFDPVEFTEVPDTDAPPSEPETQTIASADVAPADDIISPEA